MQSRLTCVVLCAGKGTRIYPFSRTVPKVMVLVGKKPVLWYVIQYWKQYADDFVFVVGYKKKQVIKYEKTSR
ncbi:MAG: sugar phosphate nucleotidyltransferase [Euryarchaeota archaeon]|nr:sugar phosphate nucleotidyltransferase [Euryarchaeota archaeon]